LIWILQSWLFLSYFIWNFLVPGAGATEAILSYKLQSEAKSLEDLSQYAFNRFALSFEIIPRILSDNAGLNSNEIIPRLNTANKTEPYGINIEAGDIAKVTDLSVYDHLQSKAWAIRLAADAAITILKVDQVETSFKIFFVFEIFIYFLFCFEDCDRQTSRRSKDVASSRWRWLGWQRLK